MAVATAFPLWAAKWPFLVGLQLRTLLFLAIVITAGNETKSD